MTTNDDLVAGAQAVLERGRPDEALRLFDNVLRSPGLAPATRAAGLSGRGNCLLFLGRPAPALADFDAALAAGAPPGEAHYGRAMALHLAGRLDAALAAFDAAVAALPRHAFAQLDRALLLIKLGQPAAAAAGLEAALAIAPDLPEATSELLYLRIQIADWRDHDRLVARLRDGLVRGSDTTLSHVLALIDDPALLARASADQLRGFPASARPPARADAGPIRIGYLSADFHTHATMYLFADALAAHDRQRFHVTLLSLGAPRPGDPWRARAMAAADTFIDLGQRSDAEMVAAVRAQQLDVLVDLKGLTAGARPGVLAGRPAPLIVNFLGFPGSMAADWMDYIVVDAQLIPAEARHHYRERLLVLPDCYQPNCRLAPLTAPPRARVGLPGQGPGDPVIFCCFNQVYKIMPEVFATWLEILRAVPDSRLWLWADAPAARANLAASAAAGGVDPARLVFAGKLPREAHLARLGCADLFLDTAPCGAHTTASDAIRAGVPIITRPGRSLASRVAASLLTTLGLEELIAADAGQYRDRAIALARDPAALAAVRARLVAARDSGPLFDPVRFIRGFEAGIAAAVARSRAGLPPGDISVTPDPGPA